MRSYYWKPEWWIDGMSMMCLAHLFCSANALTLLQFRRYFDDEKKLRGTTSHNYSAAKSSFDLERLLHGIGIEPEHGTKLFPSNYSIARDWGELRGVLKLCPTCMKQGVHLSVHQMSWMLNCPVHNEPLLRACRCGTPKYTLTPKSKNGDALCRCGALRFGDFVRFSKREMDSLNEFYRVIETLQRALPNGINQYRISTDEVDRFEYHAQWSLATKVLRILADDVPQGVDLSKIRMEPVDIWRGQFAELRVERFRLFCKYAMQCADDSAENWDAALIGRLVEEEYFGDKGKSEIRLAMEHNGCPYRMRDEDVRILQEIFSIRLLERVAQGARPVRRSLHPDLRLAMRMVGEPLCQIVWQRHESGAQTKGIAYWLDEDESWPDGKWPWLRALARNIVRTWHDYAGQKYRIEALERNLDEPAFIELFDNRDAQLNASGCRQLRLFDWLE